MSAQSRTIHTRVVAGLLLACTAIGNAQDAPELSPLPSLDELLGLDETGSPDDAGVTPDDQQAKDLDRKLTAQETADALSQAVQLMDDTADRLARPGGTDLVTQRLQEDILRKLDTVIAAAQQNQSQGGGSSAGSQSQQSQAQSPGKQKSGAQSMPGKGDGNTESMPQAGGEASAAVDRQLLDASAWGALPERLRNALQQGLSDRFSATYRSLTEAYYRRLAEEAEANQ